MTEPKLTHSFAILTEDNITPARRIDVFRFDDDITQIELRTWYNGTDNEPFTTILSVTSPAYEMLRAALNEDIEKWRVDDEGHTRESEVCTDYNHT